jgi:type II secretory pathway component PulM
MSNLSTRIRGVIDRVQDLLADMTPRDRSLLLGLVGFAALLLVGGSIWAMSSTISSLDSRLRDRELTLTRVQAMAAQQATAEGEAAAIEEQLQKFAGTDLSSFMEQAARNASVGDRLDSVREKSSASSGNIEERLYSVSLNSLTLSEMTDFLYEVEGTGYPLRIKTFKVKTRKRGEVSSLSVEMDVSAYRLIEDADAGEEG